MKKVLFALAALFYLSVTVVAQHDTHTELHTYPNPFVESVVVSTSFNSGYVNIYTLEGRCVYSNQFGSNHFELGADLPTGIYIMMLYCAEDERNRQTIKIVKQH